MRRSASKRLAAGLLPSLLCASAVGCGHSPSAPRNSAPVIQQTTAQLTRLNPGGQTHLLCAAVDVDADALSFSWRAAAGALTGTGASVTLTAPSTPGSYYVAVTVTDGRGGEARDSVRFGVAAAGAAVKAVVLRSRGTTFPALWQYVNDHWNVFGATPVSIDVASFDHVGITYAELAASGAEVVILDDARDPSSLEVYTSNEVAAIMRYVTEGHGLIVTGGTLRPAAHAPLLALLGFQEWVGGQIYYATSRVDSIVLAIHQPGLPTGLTAFTTQSLSYYSGSDWNNDGRISDMADWASVIVTPRAKIVAYIWNWTPDHSRLETSVISYIETRDYRAVFSGAGQSADGSMTGDDLQFFYNSVVYCAGL